MNWQSLPPIFLYPMLIPHVFKLCIKYKTSISIITKSNPAFPYGGLPFASKKDIFDVFKNKKEFLPYELIKYNIELEQKIQISKNFISKVSYPIIAKPDTSHRGIDVNLINNENELVELLKNQKWDYILQEYCDYNYEFGVFYSRLPKDKKGSIVSLSSKKIPIIFGNGKDNLKTLILNAEIDNKKNILEKFEKKLDFILPQGESLKTLVCASHAQGAIFSDAKDFITQNLIDKTDEICNVEGFYFGRLDVRAKSLEALKEGDFRIIEINGATSEFIHIYDKNYSFKEGLSELKRQWNLLFEISNENRNIKTNNLSFFEFIKEYIRFFLLTKKVTGRLW